MITTEQRQEMLEEKLERLRVLNSRGVIHTQEIRGGNLLSYDMRVHIIVKHMVTHIVT